MMKRKILATILYVSSVFNMCSIVLSEESEILITDYGVTYQTETVNGRNIHHIDISDKFEIDTIGNSGDSVNYYNESSTYLYEADGVTNVLDTKGRNAQVTNQYTDRRDYLEMWWAYTLGRSSTATSARYGYPASMSAINTETGDITLNKLSQSETDSSVFTETSETFTFKTFNPEGFKGGVADADLGALGISSTRDVGSEYYALLQVPTSSIKILTGSVHNNDWTQIAGYVRYTDGTYDKFAKGWKSYEKTNTTTPYDWSLDQDYSPYGDSNWLLNNTDNVRRFARSIESVTPVYPVASEDGTGYTLASDESITVNNVGFVGWEIDVDPTKTVKNVELRKAQSADARYTRSYPIYALAQLEATEEEISTGLKTQLEEIDALDLEPDSNGLYTEEQIESLKSAISLLERYDLLNQGNSDFSALRDDIEVYRIDEEVAEIKSALAEYSENPELLGVSGDGYTYENIVAIENVRKLLKEYDEAKGENSHYSELREKISEYDSVKNNTVTEDENGSKYITEKISGHVVNHIDISESFEIDTIGAVGDIVNYKTKTDVSDTSLYSNQYNGSKRTYGGAWWPYTFGNSYGYYGFDKNMSAINLDSSEITVNMLNCTDEENQTYEDTTNPYVFKTFIEDGFSGGIADADLISLGLKMAATAGSQNNESTYTLKNVKTSSVKLLTGSMHANDWTKMIVEVFYENELEPVTHARGWKNIVANSTKPYDWSLKQLYSASGDSNWIASNTGNNIRRFARDIDTRTPVYPVLNDEGQYILQRDETVTVEQMGFLGWEIDTDPTKVIEKIRIRCQGATNWTRNQRSFPLYAIDQIEANDEEKLVYITEKFDEIKASEIQIPEDGKFSTEENELLAVAGPLWDMFIELGGDADGYADVKALIDVYNSYILYPDVHITFDDETAKDEKENQDAKIVGDAGFITGINGTKALEITNTFGKEAQEYLDMGEYDFSESDFSIVFWMKTPGRGVSGFEASTDQIEADAILDFSAYSGNMGGVVISNKDFSTPDNSGFAFAAMPINSYFAYNMKIGENTTVNADGIRTPVDSRWHQISYVVNRSGKAIVYVDNVKVSEKDISTLSGGLGSGNLIFGADGLGQYGMEHGIFDDIRIYSSALDEIKVTELYYMGSLNNTNGEIKAALTGENAEIYPEQEKAALSEILKASEEYYKAYMPGNKDELINEYNELNVSFNKFLNKGANVTSLFISDVHNLYANDTHESSKNLIKALTETPDMEGKLSTIAISGDLTQLGSDHLDFFTNRVKANLPEGTKLSLCRGNHDNWVSSGDSVVYGSIGAIIGAFNKFLNDGIVDKTDENNKKILDSNGNVAYPWYYTTDGAAHYIALDAYYFDPSGGRRFSDAQLSWLDETLSNISGDGKAIFIVEHNPLRETTNGWDYIGLPEEEDAKLKEIIGKYDNIIVLNGHSHHGMGSGNTVPWYDSEGRFIQINGPVLCHQSMKRGYNAGCGYYMNIYDDRIVFRARDIENGIWLREYDFTVKLTAAKPAEMGEITISDNETVYETAADAKGKEVTVTAPVNFAEESGEFVAILAEYSGDALLKVTTQAVLYTDTEIEFNTTLSENTMGIKIMIFDSLQGMKPMTDSVVK